MYGANIEGCRLVTLMGGCRRLILQGVGCRGILLKCVGANTEGCREC